MCLKKQKEILQKVKQITNKHMLRGVKQHNCLLRHQARTKSLHSSWWALIKGLPILFFAFIPPLPPPHTFPLE